MHKLLIAFLASFACAPAFAQWTRVDVSGVRLCRSATGEQMVPTSQSPNWVNFACTTLNSAEAQGAVFRIATTPTPGELPPVLLDLDVTCIPRDLSIGTFPIGSCLMGSDAGLARWSLLGDTVGWSIDSVGTIRYSGQRGSGFLRVRVEGSNGAVETGPLSWNRP